MVLKHNIANTTSLTFLLINHPSSSPIQTNQPKKTHQMPSVFWMYCSSHVTCPKQYFRKCILWFAIKIYSFAVIFGSKVKKDCPVNNNWGSIIHNTNEQQKERFAYSSYSSHIQCVTTVVQSSRLYWIFSPWKNILINLFASKERKDFLCIDNCGWILQSTNK